MTKKRNNTQPIYAVKGVNKDINTKTKFEKKIKD
jgi:hypothetical protein